MLLVAVTVSTVVSGGVAVAAWRTRADDRDRIAGVQARLAFESTADAAQCLSGRLDALSVLAGTVALASGDVAAAERELVNFRSTSYGFDGGLALVTVEGDVVATTAKDPVASTSSPSDRAVWWTWCRWPDGRGRGCPRRSRPNSSGHPACYSPYRLTRAR